jgi:hypothetical protein
VSAILLVSGEGSGLGLNPIGVGLTVPDGSTGFGDDNMGSKVTLSGPVPGVKENPPNQAPMPTADLTPSCKKKCRQEKRRAEQDDDRQDRTQAVALQRKSLMSRSAFMQSQVTYHRVQFKLLPYLPVLPGPYSWQ